MSLEYLLCQKVRKCSKVSGDTSKGANLKRVALAKLGKF